MKRIIAAALAVSLVMPAWAQEQSGPQCAKYEDVRDILNTRFKETRQVIGLGRRGGVVIIWASEAGTWTMTISAPNGTTCIVAEGQAFEALGEQLEPAGERL